MRKYPSFFPRLFDRSGYGEVIFSLGIRCLLGLPLVQEQDKSPTQVVLPPSSPERFAILTKGTTTWITQRGGGGYPGVLD